MIIIVVFLGDPYGPNAGRILTVTWLLDGTENDVVKAQLWANQIRFGRAQVYAFDDETPLQAAHARALEDFTRST